LPLHRVAKVTVNQTSPQPSCTVQARGYLTLQVHFSVPFPFETLAVNVTLVHRQNPPVITRKPKPLLYTHVHSAAANHTYSQPSCASQGQCEQAAHPWLRCCPSRTAGPHPPSYIHSKPSLQPHGQASGTHAQGCGADTPTALLGHARRHTYRVSPSPQVGPTPRTALWLAPKAHFRASPSAACDCAHGFQAQLPNFDFPNVCSLLG
jgi:hypothetical protein